jgi:CheY-like chemotaxis protein
MARAVKSRNTTASLGRILVVEDDALLCLAMETALLDGGASTVECCATTEAALAALEHGRPDVVVLDVHLADRDDGWAIAELVTQLGPRPPRIVFSTASPDAIPPEIAGLGTVIEKPYSPEDLVSAVREVGLFGRLRGESATPAP